MLVWDETVLSQYKSSPRLMALLSAINSWVDPYSFWEQFLYSVWDIDTATGYGLDNWGRILVMPRTLALAPFPTFGFGEAQDRVGFGQGPFSDFGHTLTQNFTLTDDTYRRMLLAKAAFNITDGSVPAINSILMSVLFPGRGNAYVRDGGNAMPATFGFAEPGDRLPFGLGPFGDYIPRPAANMTLTYVFDFPLEPFEVAMVTSGVLPKPTGVLAYWLYNQSTVGGSLLIDNNGALAVSPLAGYPTAPLGLLPGSIWSDGGQVAVIPGTSPNPTAAPVFFGAILAADLLALGGANLPTSDPGVLNQLWNDGGAVAISLG